MTVVDYNPVERILVEKSSSCPADAETCQGIADALTELEVHGHFFGSVSLTLAPHGTDARALQQQAAEAMKVMAAHDGSLFEESYNLLNAWLSMVPGNSAHNLRRLALLERNLADLSFLFTLDAGERVSAHASPLLGCGASGSRMLGFGDNLRSLDSCPEWLPAAIARERHDLLYVLLLQLISR